MSNASLIVVGSGIKFISHLTTEARTYIEQSNKVLYLVNEPAMKSWIQKTNPQAESLDNLYIKHRLRRDCYLGITQYILEMLRKNQHVCVVLYGHPTVFSKPALDAVIQAKNEGYYAKVLPDISSEDCLFADLLIDPGSCGCQSFEATDFLIHHRQFDRNSHVILWQIGSIGILDHAVTRETTKNIDVLVDYLSQYYSAEYEVIVYEAAQYPCFEPSITRLPLKELSQTDISGISTLYIPPISTTPCDVKMLAALKININDLS
jgi:tetrapyrrole methylase family protein/MazG family protein